jgi:hypothetical protein
MVRPYLKTRQSKTKKFVMRERVNSLNVRGQSRKGWNKQLQNLASKDRGCYGLDAHRLSSAMGMAAMGR